MSHNGKSITIQYVARAAGVSVSTVSRVLNKKDDVAPETAEKVQSVIQQMGYVSSLAARGMRSQRTNVIGLVMPEVGSAYCFEIMRGVNRIIAQIHYDLIIYTDCDPSRESAAVSERAFVALLNGGITDGVIVVAPTASSFASSAPVVVVDPNHESPELPGVISTNYDGVCSAMNYLIGLGHRRIAHITGRMELVSSNQRLQAYKDSLCAAGIPLDETLIEFGDYRSQAAAASARKLLAMENRPTAIFAASDDTAFGVYAAAKEAGLHIPTDLSVVGFDNLHESSFIVPALTTVDQFMKEMGAVATDMIVKLIKGEPLPAMLHVIKTQLVIRDSCSPIS